MMVGKGEGRRKACIYTKKTERGGTREKRLVSEGDPFLLGGEGQRHQRV